MQLLELYIENTRIDLHDGENITYNVSAQNIRDLGRVFGDYSQSFTLPATPTNNKVFQHYYQPDLDNSLNANTRLEAFIQINTFLYRSGVVEIESVAVEHGRPKHYTVAFYGMNTSLKDKFEEKKLSDLDLSAYDHPYSDYNRKAGVNSYASGTNSSIIYPLITSDDDWFYNSNSANHNDNNIAYHTTNDVHGIEAFMLKPALKVSRIIEAMEADFSITFNSTFFGTNKFTDLFMYLNAKEGYIFGEIGEDYTDLTTYTVPSGVTSLVLEYDVDLGTLQYQLVFTLNGEPIGTQTIATNLTNATFIYDGAQQGDVAGVHLRGLNGRFTEIDGFDWEWKNVNVSLGAQQSIGTRSHTPQITISELIPEMKISEFFSGILKMFNLVVMPTAKDTYTIEPLDDWYADGTTYDITKYVDASGHTMDRLPLYNRIAFNYEEPETIVNSQYLLNNKIAYGDLEAEFTFDGDEFTVELPFQTMLFERLTDEQDKSLTNVLVGKCFDRDLKSVADTPILFYKSGTVSIADNSINWVNSYLSNSEVTSIWHCQNVHTSGFSLNWGSEIDPYSLDTEENGLYKTYWEDYITDLYDSARRLWKYNAVLPLSIVTQINPNDTLTIWNRNYRINSMKVNLMTGQTQLELLNDV